MSEASKNPVKADPPDSRPVTQVPYPVTLAGQPALVTGANSGIGKAVALGLASMPPIQKGVTVLRLGGTLPVRGDRRLPPNPFIYELPFSPFMDSVGLPTPLQSREST